MSESPLHCCKKKNSNPRGKWNQYSFKWGESKNASTSESSESSENMSIFTVVSYSDSSTMWHEIIPPGSMLTADKIEWLSNSLRVLCFTNLICSCVYTNLLQQTHFKLFDDAICTNIFHLTHSGRNWHLLPFSFHLSLQH